MNVRLPDDLRVRLDRVAKNSKLKAADLIRMAVEEYCETVERTGKITIPYLNDSPGAEALPPPVKVTYKAKKP